MESLFTGHAERLLLAESYGVRIEIRVSVQRHAAALCGVRFFQGYGKRQYGLIALHSHTISAGMKESDILLFYREVFLYTIYLPDIQWSIIMGVGCRKQRLKNVVTYQRVSICVLPPRYWFW